MNLNSQKQVFLAGEGDQWFKRNVSQLSPLRPELEMLAPFVRKSHRVLEIGCSNGFASEFFNSKQASYVGLDPSQKAIEQARLQYPGSQFHCGTADQLPFEDEYFDLVYFGFCLYLVDRKLLSRVVAEADRVLRTPGYLGIRDFGVKYPQRRDYVHLKGVSTYKFDYAALFLAFPQYSKIFSSVASYHNVDERVSVDILWKS